MNLRIWRIELISNSFLFLILDGWAVRVWSIWGCLCKQPIMLNCAFGKDVFTIFCLQIMHGESVSFAMFTFSPTFVPFLDPTLKSGSVVQRVCEHTVSGLNKASDRRPSCCGRRPIFIARPPNPPDPSRKMFKPRTKATVSKLFRRAFAEALWRVGLIRFLMKSGSVTLSHVRRAPAALKTR